MQKQNLKNVRLAKGVTQQKMADVICRDKSAYCRKERGEAKILMTEWQKMALYLQVDLEEIYQNDLEGSMSALNGQYYCVPIGFVAHLQDYVVMLKNENIQLKEALAAARKELAAKK